MPAITGGRIEQEIAHAQFHAQLWSELMPNCAHDRSHRSVNSFPEPDLLRPANILDHPLTAHHHQRQPARRQQPPAGLVEVGNRPPAWPAPPTCRAGRTRARHRLAKSGRRPHGEWIDAFHRNGQRTESQFRRTRTMTALSSRSAGSVVRITTVQPGA